MGRRRAVQVIEIEKVDIGPLGQPVDGVLKLKLGAARSGFVFTMRAGTRAGMSQEQFVQSAQSLGDLVHPHQAVLIVLPDDACDLRAFSLLPEQKPHR